MVNAPGPRTGHTAVWTGTEMIVWGGFNAATWLNNGGRYNPATNSWTSISLVQAPVGRTVHSAVWTGSEMIIWGGFNGDSLNSGGRYKPGTDTWVNTNLVNAPSDRGSHTAVWTGSEMIVWGGFQHQVGTSNTGSRYNPVNDSWTAISTTNAPAGRASHTAVWTNTEMIVWAGSNDAFLNTGGRYSPATNTWAPTDVSTAPPVRALHTAVWTGVEMMVWGGQGLDINSGARYYPATDRWIAICGQNGPPSRVSSSAVWTGSEMIFWGGTNGINIMMDTGGRYSLRPLQLILEQSGSLTDQAAALESVLFTRDPFSVLNAANFFNSGADRNTRVMVFAANFVLPPGAPSSSVVINLVDSSNHSYDIPVEDARQVANFYQLTFRLPDSLAVGVCTVSIKSQGRRSNVGKIRIRS
jgi:N-acetylneuraminic acid mutarotase